MAGKFHETNIIQSITANGDYPADGFNRMNGDRVIGMYGNLDGATVKFIFYTEKPDGEFAELPESPDWVFTSKPAPERFSFSIDMPFKVRVTGVGASTDFGINTHQLRD